MSKYVFGGMTFQSKEKLTNYVKYVLNNQKRGTFLEGKWFDVVNDILKQHENYQQKVGAGEYKIGVRACSVNPKNNQFYILRQDGTDTDFSFYKALTKRSQSSKVKESLRGLIKDQMISYKEDYFNENSDSKGYCICPVTNLKITKKSSHLDHYPVQFDQIVSDWLESNNLCFDGIGILPTQDNDTHGTLADENLADSFYKYHLLNAQYRVVLDKVNLQRERWKKAK